MSKSYYVRPTGFLYGSASKDAVMQGHAGKLAGGSVAFTTLEVIEGRPGRTKPEFRPFAALAGSADRDLTSALEKITSTRAAIGRISLDQPRIMGVVNVTPDSFSDGGLHDSADAAIAHGLQLAKEGADILDIGGESTRPGSDPVSVEDEAARVLPVIEGLKRAGPILSVDTRKSSIMEQTVKAGAAMLNDVSALTHDPDSLGVAAKSGLPVVLMHAQGDPKTMQDDPSYEDVVLEVFDYLAGRIAACEAAGIDRSKIIADPGIGFGKTLEHNLALLSAMSLFHALGVALLLGVSRKRFIGALTGVENPRDRAPGSIAAALAGIAQGVQFVRVHDVADTHQAVGVWNAVNR